MPSIKPIYPVLAVAILSIGAVGVAFSDDDDDEGWGRRGGWIPARADVAPVNNSTYAEECGACHMAYQPGLLPAATWSEIMDPTALSSHYGDDASLSEALRSDITAYLTGGASDRSDQVRARAFGASMPVARNGGLPRISETAYFLRKHDEIPARLVRDNPKVGSFSQCNTCHQGAEKGVYNEHQVSIPGYGRWED